jgi:uncharacterized protein (UPF0332 family)
VPLVDDYFSHAAALLFGSVKGQTEQVDLRRCVSAAYYGVFHLLTHSAAERWDVPVQRARFARLFNHGKMHEASKSLNSRLKERLGSSPSRQDLEIAEALKNVASAFITLQQLRHTADYDDSKIWSYTEVERILLEANETSITWGSIKNSTLAADYLLDMLGVNR